MAVIKDISVLEDG